MTSGRVDELTQQIEDMPTVDLVAALKRVLGLHVPDKWGWCSGCYAAPQKMPCATVRAVSGDQS